VKTQMESLTKILEVLLIIKFVVL